MIVHLLRDRHGNPRFNKKELYVISIGIVFLYAMLYYISDYPLELQRRDADPYNKRQNLRFIDYFEFSILSWVTGGSGQQRFSRVDWHWTTRLLSITQKLILMYIILFI